MEEAHHLECLVVARDQSLLTDWQKVAIIHHRLADFPERKSWADIGQLIDRPAITI
jgi:hypothetical protein